MKTEETKEYLFCEVHRKNGSMFTNHLKISEVKHVAKMAKEHAHVIVHLEKTTPENYKLIFGS